MPFVREKIKRYIPGRTTVKARDMNTLEHIRQFVHNLQVGEGLKLEGNHLSLSMVAYPVLCKLKEDLYSNPNRTFKCEPITLDFENPFSYEREPGEFVDIYGVSGTDNAGVLIHARNFMYFCRETDALALVVKCDFGRSKEWVIVQTWCPGDDITVCPEPA